MQTYKDIYELDIKLWYWLEQEYGCCEKMWDLFYQFYCDPDGYPIEGDKYNYWRKIKCTADGLLSVKRIRHFEGDNTAFIDTFRKYRRSPIFFFPCETGGINGLRATMLEDRIDHTLLDLKHYCEKKQKDKGATECILYTAYTRPKTDAWLKSFGYDFWKIVEWLGVDDIFVNKEQDIVYDLENEKKVPLSKLKKAVEYVSPQNGKYLSSWSEAYYRNVKNKIEEYENKKKQF